MLSVAAIAVTLGFRSLTVNRLVKRKLRLSLVLLVASLGISILRLLYPYFSPDVAAELAAIQKPGARRGPHQRLGAGGDQPATVRPGARSVSRDPAGLHRHRSGACRVHVFQRPPAHDVCGQRGCARLRAPGHARQRVRRPGNPEREAVPRRPLDPRGRVRGSRRGSHVAGHEASNEERQLRRPAEQRRVERGDHELLRAERTDPARGAGRCRLRGASECRQGRGPRSAPKLVTDPAGTAADRRAAGVRCVGHHLPGQVLGLRVRARRRGPR